MGSATYVPSFLVLMNLTATLLQQQLTQSPLAVCTAFVMTCCSTTVALIWPRAFLGTSSDRVGSTSAGPSHQTGSLRFCPAAQRFGPNPALLSFGLHTIAAPALHPAFVCHFHAFAPSKVP